MRGNMERLKKLLGEILESGDFMECNDFIEAGLMDSMTIMDMVDRLESEFGIEISGRDIIPENFVNVDSIVRMIRKSGGEVL